MKKLIYTFVIVLIVQCTLNIELCNGQSSSTDSLKFKKDKIDLYLGFRGILPIPSTYWATALSTIDFASGSKYSVKSFGWGMSFDAKYKEYTAFFDLTSYSYDQELLEKGGKRVLTVYPYGTNAVTFPGGVKYNAKTASIRLGGKYTYNGNKTFQPWIGLALGMNIWTIKYISYNDGSYPNADAKGSTFRHAILAGLDVKYQKTIFTFFFEAVSPVAIYSIKDMFKAGQGDWLENEGWATMTYPTPRLGISFSYLMGSFPGF